MSRSDTPNVPELDRFGEAPHPRNTFVLFGHHDAEAFLLRSYRNAQLPQSLIIGGQEGIGKATLAWRFSRFLLAHPDSGSVQAQDADNLFVDPEHPAARKLSALSHGDLYLLRRQWNATDKRPRTVIRVDDVRDMVHRFHQSSTNPGWRIGIIDSADDLNRNAANAMLKLIEEPPPRSLFLFVVNQPARVLPTIRSRSQMLHLSPLGPDDIRAAIASAGPPWASADTVDVETAIARGQGSVREVMRLLDNDTNMLDELDAIMAQLPQVDWGAVHALADAVNRTGRTEDFEAVVTGIYDWLSGQLALRAGQQLPPAALAPLAELWEKVADSTRQVETFNLDRRPFLLNLFSDLANAAAGGNK